jgi:hypothetical protein
LNRACGLLPTLVRSEPSDTAEPVSELLPGEGFSVLEYASGWAWGYCRIDHRVGYVEAIELVDPFEPTHIVIEPSAPIQLGADPVSPALSSLPMGSRVRGEARGALLATESGYIPLSYLRPIGEHEDDPVAVAQRLLNAPYMRGGRTIHGVDCSALVQLSLSLCGIPAPRDAQDQQQLGERLAPGSALRRGDLVFCDEHVGMMLDDLLVIHVGPERSKVTVEPLDAARPIGSCAEMERRRLSR